MGRLKSYGSGCEMGCIGPEMVRIEGIEEKR